MESSAKHVDGSYAEFLGRTPVAAPGPQPGSHEPAAGVVVYEMATGKGQQPRIGGDLAGLLGDAPPAGPPAAGPLPWLALVHPDDAPACQALRDRAWQQRLPLQLAYRLRHADGGERLLEEQAHWLEPDGPAARLVGVVRDVTAQRQGETTLRLNEERLSLALAAGRLGSWDWSIHTEQLEWSAAARQMFGLAPDAQVDFARFIGLLHPQDAPRVQQAIATALETGADYLVAFRVQWPDGSLHWLQARGRPQQGAEGQSVRMSGVVQDITEQVAREAAEAAQAAQQLQARKLQAVGTFAAGIAHDFNNMLAALLGHLGLAAEQLVADDAAGAGSDAETGARASIDQAALAARRARALTQDILAFSRDEPAQMAPLALGPLMQETARLVQASLPAGATLDLQLPAAPVWVHGNRSQLQRVLMNLCSNAWQALPEGGGRITLRLDGEGGSASMAVADDGAGIDETLRQRLFEPFFTTRGASGGSGLGLSVVHGIVGAHGGSIDVQSTPGQGTCFTLRLPACPAPAADDGHGAGPGSSGKAPQALLPAAGTGPLVVYVDDDEVLLVLVGRLLARAGCRPHCISSPAEALQLASDPAAAIALLITDLDMPAMSGVALAEAVRASRPGLPLVICSGSVDQPLLAQAARLGVAHVVGKAHLLDDLPGCLGGLLPLTEAAGRPKVP